MKSGCLSEALTTAALNNRALGVDITAVEEANKTRGEERDVASDHHLTTGAAGGLPRRRRWGRFGTQDADLHGVDLLKLLDVGTGRSIGDAHSRRPATIPTATQDTPPLFVD